MIYKFDPNLIFSIPTRIQPITNNPGKVFVMKARTSKQTIIKYTIRQIMDEYGEWEVTRKVITDTGFIYERQFFKFGTEKDAQNFILLRKLEE